ncbi:glycoside hydrolase domain-containing protein [Actinoplanes sp. N902-109]|uniref:glycoside hydrolase domain-containing protein n=1 Tax=Actinoplanes sp. (strain N902-109) TaxID=649831 RepID=UPI0003295F72|nr:glycoside hydrolase domain-containing protein [Actinoplanes sp. N902-109]AGL17271.1 hypothetical protein L083_3761 [Actinoplanes sp. N902-109]
MNATYRTVSGYTPVTEDGITGSQTTGALTRALQHELGLTSLADNFGTGTLAALTNHGPVSAGEANHNIVFIVQGGAICKGYDPGTLDGVWGTRTTTAITAMMTDAGLATTDGTLQPKVFKALLSTDSYLLAAGGSAAVRAAQQWLNNRYLNRSAFFVLPCDGVGTPAILKALTFGIQYEAGLDDATANGNFGPLTQSSLRSRGLIQTGSTGAWVRLFSGALALYPSAQTFTDTFDATLAGQVRAFQRFVALAETGAGDFATWAALLISTGDPARPATAADTITEVTAARATALTNAGYSLVGRYLTNVEGSDFDKKLKPGEPATLFANGMRLFPIFQTANDSAEFFTYQQGYDDALAAHDAALGFNLDAGATIYFAVDFDATDKNVDERIVPYFLGVAAGLRARGNRYAHGNYGARNVCTRLFREAYTLRGFVSGITTGWTANVGYPLPDNWLLDQFATVTVGSGAASLEVDRCVLRPYGDQGEGATGSPAATLDQFLAWIDRLSALATAYGQGDPDRLVLQYLRAGRHDTWQSRQLNGDTDAGFAAYVGAAGGARIRTYRDPVANVDVDASRFADATLGALQSGIRADFGSWGQDWVALYGDWQFTAPGTPGKDRASTMFAKSSVVSAFTLAAMVADVDAYHAAAALTAGTRLAAHLRGTARTSRFRRFFQTRFGGSAALAATAARDVLTSTADAQVAAARDRMLRGQATTPVPASDQMTAFCQVFADRLVALAWAEAK